MGQIIKSVSVCQTVCPSVGTLIVAILDRFSSKLAQTYEHPKVKTIGTPVKSDNLINTARCLTNGAR